MKKPAFRPELLPYEMETLQDLVLGAGERYSERCAVRTESRRLSSEQSYAQLLEDVLALSASLEELAPAGAHVALLGGNSYGWLVSFLAISAGGRVAVLLDAGAPDAEWSRCLTLTDTNLLLCAQELLPKAQSLEARTFSIRERLDLARQAGPVRAFSRPVNGASPAAIVFTSGTSGEAKAVLLSHGNLVSDIKASLLLTEPKKEDRIFTVLPPHHAFQLVTGLLTPVYVGGQIGIGRGLKYVQKDFELFRPTFMVLVPLIVKALDRQIRQELERSGRTRRAQGAAALSRWLLPLGVDLRPRLFREIRERFGGELKYVVCGGAPLEQGVARRLTDYGIPIMVGYGITECSPVVSCNMARNQRFGSIGLPSPYCQVRIQEEEIQVSGPIVAQGYYGRPDLTAESFREGWFCTGDLGRLDKDGFLYITGRRKNLFVLANGKNVSPEELELALRELPEVREALVSLEQKDEAEFLCATVYPEDSLLELGEETCQEQLRQALTRLNGKLPPYKQLRGLRLSKEPLGRTGSGKLKRELQSPAEAPIPV